MDELLSLKWKNHCSTFLQILSIIRKDQTYSDVTLACSGKFYHAHKMVLTACSEYFREIFEHTDCKKPVIVLKGISCVDLEVLLDYMYIGEVNVKQSDITSLIKSAECLQIKGLAVADDEPTKQQKYMPSKKRTSSPIVKGKRKHDIQIHSSDNKHFKSDNKFSSIENKHSSSTKNMEETKQLFIKEEIVDSFPPDPVEEPLKAFEKHEHQLPSECDDGSNSSNYMSQPSNSQVLPSYPENRLPGTSPNFEDNSSEWTEMDSTMDYAAFTEYDNADGSSQANKQKIKCSLCQKELSTKGQLQIHMRIHTGEKPFHCHFCSYKANVKSNLRRHLVLLHSSIESNT